MDMLLFLNCLHDRLLGYHRVFHLPYIFVCLVNLCMAYSRFVKGNKFEMRTCIASALSLHAYASLRLTGLMDTLMTMTVTMTTMTTTTMTMTMTMTMTVTMTMTMTFRLRLKSITEQKNRRVKYNLDELK